MSAYRAELVKRMIYVYGSEENGLVIKFVNLPFFARAAAKNF